jgi:oligopeptide/dipeptide ABC transporter ATP-binding protein
MFIAHDLKVACYFCDRIGVMYKGELMEEASAQILWKEGLHPYTGLLFSSVSMSAMAHKQKDAAKSQVEITGNDEGCVFAGRCPYAEEQCTREKPQLRTIREGHRVRCFKI